MVGGWGYAFGKILNHKCCEIAIGLSNYHYSTRYHDSLGLCMYSTILLVDCIII